MYKVNRTSLWFCKNDKVSKEDLEKYFNQEAIKQLIIDGFIEEIKIERVLPKSWEELGRVKGFYVDDDSEVCTALNFDLGYSTDLDNQNIFPTEAVIGTGVDYWLGYKKDHDNYNEDNFMNARLEISGINKETDSNTIEGRVKIKRDQVKKTDGMNIPVYISVSEFSTPKSIFIKK